VFVRLQISVGVKRSTQTVDATSTSGASHDLEGLQVRRRRGGHRAERDRDRSVVTGLGGRGTVHDNLRLEQITGSPT
jgi:hypothetical protein